MSLTCNCGGKFVPRMEKVKFVAGTTVGMTLLGLVLGTPTGWFALASAAAAGSKQAKQLLLMKQRLWYASSQKGSLLMCGKCGRKVSLFELFSGNPPRTPIG